MTLILTVIFVALVFEYINGFHDTANSIATVVSTKVLSPRQAVVLAAVTNLLGALWGTAVAKTIASGLVDTKTSLLESVVSGRTKYHVIHFEERNFTFPAPGIALESGRAHMKATSSTGESDAIFSFLAVWRLEKGQWRFLAWQSCKLPPAAPEAKAK